MTAPAALLAYAVILAVLGPKLLRMGSWTERAPRLGILAWQAATASVLGAAILAGLALVVPVAQAPHALAGLLASCWMMIRAHYESAPQPVGAYAGILVAGGMLLWTTGQVMACLIASTVQRRRHLAALRMVARHRTDLGALVIEHDQPLAYCLPGRHRCVVLSTGAVERLHDDQLSAVLAHERAHLRGRHDLAVNLAYAIDRAFPGVPLLRAARSEIPRLIELLADDVAARTHDRITVATALVTVAGGRAPTAALGAGGETALVRVRRMLAPYNPLSRTARLTGAVAIALLLASPITLALNPAIVAILEEHCHLPW